MCIQNNILIYCLHANNGFLEAWLAIRIPHRSTSQFLLNNRLHKENEVMKKIRIRIEWSYGLIKSFWKLVTHYLSFKLDQNHELCVQTLRVTYLLFNFRTCYKGNSISDVVSFSHSPPTIKEYLNNIQIIKITCHLFTHSIFVRYCFSSPS